PPAITKSGRSSPTSNPHSFMVTSSLRALTSVFAVRLRHVGRRPVCGNRRDAPQFGELSRSLVRPFPHSRSAYRVWGASPVGGPAPRYNTPRNHQKRPLEPYFKPAQLHLQATLLILAARSV